jgi:adenylosuccinate lyase
MNSSYKNPLIERYASEEMSKQFSPDMKFSTWRKLWIALAKVEKELGLNITDEQIETMEAHIYDIDYDKAKMHEKDKRHDVMAHVHTFGEQCPVAMPIIHLGATSCYVGDNTDLIMMRGALKIVERKLAVLLNQMATFATEYKSLPTLGFTHYQPAQLTTVGKRATLWMNEFLMDLEDTEYVIENLMMRGAKGTTGTQASYLNLFDGNHDKVRALDEKVAEYFDFKGTVPVTGQTYSRKVDSKILNVLSGIAQSAHKMTNDIRLLQNLKELEEPFEKNQIGSSAMAYKRNPMRSERVSSLAKYVMSLSSSPGLVAATQWFERTLDDSANKRLTIPEAFLAVDAILDILLNVTSGMVVYEKVITKRVMSELPFMATENIIMEAVKKGGDRQELHEAIRVHSMDAGRVVKVDGGDNDLLERIEKDPMFGLSHDDILSLMEPSQFIGRSAEQTDEYVKEIINPKLDRFKEHFGAKVELKV